METKDYLKPEIIEVDLDIQSVLCMSVEEFKKVELDYEGL